MLDRLRLLGRETEEVLKLVGVYFEPGEVVDHSFEAQLEGGGG